MNEDLIFILKLIRSKTTPTTLCDKVCNNRVYCSNCLLDVNRNHKYSSVIFKYKGE